VAPPVNGVAAQKRFLALLVLLLGSGASALAYQVLWLRELSLIFGVTVHAAVTVLAAFMGGLALGGSIAGRVLTRLRRPLLAFGLAELLIGASALAVGVAFDRAAPVDAALHDALGGSGARLTAGRFAVAAALLLVPTSLMGLTMPLVGASAIVREASGVRLSLAYGVNTAGGVLGVIATGFYGVGLLGSDTTLRMAAAVNVTVGLAAMLWSRLDHEPAEAMGGAPEAPAIGGPVASNIGPPIPVAVLGIVVTASGAASMALEVFWFRALVQLVPATVYAFTAMLAVVLAGLAIGSFVAARLLRRPGSWAAWLGRLHYATAAAALLSLALLAAAASIVGARWEAAAALAMLPATLGMGASFPVALQAAAAAGRSAADVARRIGRLYAANVAGAVAGVVLAGFVLLPQLGVRAATIVAGLVFAATALLLRLASRRFRAVLDLPLLAGLGALVMTAPDPLGVAFAHRHGDGQPPAWRHDGAQATVMVHAARSRRILYVDGLHQASDRPEMVKVHRTIGHLAMALHPDPRNVLVIGLGGGATAGAVSRHEPRTLDLVELSEGVRLAAPLFTHVSYDVLHRPGTVLHMDDARTFLLTTRERFDVVTADIIQPTHAGAGGLYSREYFERVRSRLRPGGLMLQWVGQRQDTTYKLMTRTFVEVFPHATAWVGGTLLVGTTEPLQLSRSAFERKLADPDLREALAAVDVTSFDGLCGWYTADGHAIRRFVGPGPVLTDDRPLVEYFRTLPADEPLARLDELTGDVRALVVP
jgi:spermidine synthase